MQNRGKLDDTLAAMFSNTDYRSDYLFYAHMIGQCSIKIMDDLPAPAGVQFSIDHYNLFINPERFDKYNLKERLAILKHEMLHILQKHVMRRDERDPLPWNYATDCAINQLVNSAHLPDNCVTPKTLGQMIGKNVLDDKSSEAYFELIKEKIKEEQENGNQGEQGEDGDGKPSFGQGEGDPQLMDDHAIWEESEGDKELQEDMTKKMIEKSSSETLKGKGTVPSQMSDWLELHSRPSEVNWKKVLRGIVGNKRVGSRSTIMRNDRRFPKRADLRGKTKDRMFNLLVVADVSGSMSDKAVMDTLAEVRHICDVTKTDVDLIQVDAYAYTPEKLSKTTKLIDRKGCGGTTLYPAIERAQEAKIDFQAVVVLTDGGLWGNDIENFANLNKRVIWLVEEHGHVMDEMDSGRMQAFKLTGKKKE